MCIQERFMYRTQFFVKMGSSRKGLLDILGLDTLTVTRIYHHHQQNKKKEYIDTKRVVTK